MQYWPGSQSDPYAARRSFRERSHRVQAALMPPAMPRAHSMVRMPYVPARSQVAVNHLIHGIVQGASRNQGNHGHHKIPVIHTTIHLLFSTSGQGLSIAVLPKAVIYNSSFRSPAFIQPAFLKSSPKIQVRIAGRRKHTKSMPSHIRVPPPMAV